MRFEDYVRILRKRWWMVGLVVLTAAIAAYGFSKLQTPMYRSQARYGILFNRLDTGGNIFAAQILNSYVNTIYRPNRMQVVSDQLGLDLTGRKLMEFVRLQPQPNESVIMIEADYFDAATSQRLADTVGQLLNAQVVEVNRNYSGEDRVSLDLAPAEFVGLAQPKTRINVLAGGLLGGILGVLLVFVLEYLDDTLKNAADIERYTSLVTIGAIPSGAAQGGRLRPRLRPATTAGIVAQPSQRKE